MRRLGRRFNMTAPWKRILLLYTFALFIYAGAINLGVFGIFPATPFLIFVLWMAWKWRGKYAIATAAIIAVTMPFYLARKTHPEWFLKSAGRGAYDERSMSHQD
jgi:hypothetical protein